MNDTFKPVLIGGINGVIISSNDDGYDIHGNEVIDFELIVYANGEHYSCDLTEALARHIAALLIKTCPMTSVNEVYLWANADALLAPLHGVNVFLQPEMRHTLRETLGRVIDIYATQRRAADLPPTPPPAPLGDEPAPEDEPPFDPNHITGQDDYEFAKKWTAEHKPGDPVPMWGTPADEDTQPLHIPDQPGDYADID